MELTVRCRCQVTRRLDPARVGPWRLRCKQCGDVLYDPAAPPAATPPAAAPSGRGTDRQRVAEPPSGRGTDRQRVAEPPSGRGTDRQRVAEPPSGRGTDRRHLVDPPPPPPADDEDSQFQRWLQGSAELKVVHSSDGGDAPPCPRHRDRRIVAACGHCSQLLCKLCLDRIDDEFVCSACVAAVAGRDPKQGCGLKAWLRRLFGKG